MTISDFAIINDLIAEINQSINQSDNLSLLIEKCSLLKEHLIQKQQLIDDELVRIPSIDIGSEVAAKISINKSQNWILASVLEYDENSKLYLIEDVETDEFSAEKARYSLNEAAIAQLNTTDNVFPVKSQVLALFPDSTCFYKATVISSPSNQQQQTEYVVEFEDDYVNGRIVQRNVNKHYIVKVF